MSSIENKQLSHRRETALQGALVLAKVEDWNGETIFCLHYRSIFNHCKAIEFGEKRKIRAITPFKVIEDGIIRKHVRNLLLVINTN